MQILRACGSLAIIFMASDAAMILKSHCQQHGLADTIARALESAADRPAVVAASRRSTREEEMSSEEPDADVLPSVRAELGRMVHAPSDHRSIGRPGISSFSGQYLAPGRPFDRPGWPAPSP
jgi:hypothetical protein